jgi:hypothetical protein
VLARKITNYVLPNPPSRKSREDGAPTLIDWDASGKPGTDGTYSQIFMLGKRPVCPMFDGIL